MNKKVSPSRINFMGFSPLESFAISRMFEEKATFIDINKSINIKDFNTLESHIVNLTLGNFEYCRNFFAKFKEEETPLVIATDVSSLDFLWFDESDFSEGTLFLFKDNGFILYLESISRGESSKFKSKFNPWSSLDLNKRQITILKLVIKGFSNKAIAEEIFQSEKTVEAEISRVAKVLGINTKVASKQNPRIMFVRKYAQILNII